MVPLLPENSRGTHDIKGSGQMRINGRIRVRLGEVGIKCMNLKRGVRKLWRTRCVNERGRGKSVERSERWFVRGVGGKQWKR